MADLPSAVSPQPGTVSNVIRPVPMRTLGGSFRLGVVVMAVTVTFGVMMIVFGITVIVIGMMMIALAMIVIVIVRVLMIGLAAACQKQNSDKEGEKRLHSPGDSRRSGAALQAV